jgi:hypothetical protein
MRSGNQAAGVPAGATAVDGAVPTVSCGRERAQRRSLRADAHLEWFQQHMDDHPRLCATARYEQVELEITDRSELAPALSAQLPPRYRERKGLSQRWSEVTLRPRPDRAPHWPVHLLHVGQATTLVATGHN